MRKKFFWVHFTIGIFAGLFILVKAVTGMCLAFDKQLIQWAEKDRRVVVPAASSDARLSLTELIEKAQSATVNAAPSSITMKSDPSSSVVVAFGRDAGIVYVNPYSGAVLGKESALSRLFDKIEDLHRWFGFRSVGEPLSGLITLGLLLQGISGLCLWWPHSWSHQKIRSITVINGALHGKARNLNWHNVCGFWLSPFIILVAITGLVMASGANVPAPTKKENSASVGLIADLKPLSVDQLMARAGAQVASWVAITLRFPNKPDQPVNVQILETDPTIGVPVRSQGTIDPITGDVKSWEPASSAGAERKIRIWSRYIHTGEAGGVLGQLLAFVTAFSVLVLVWTGFLMAIKRSIKW